MLNLSETRKHEWSKSIDMDVEQKERTALCEPVNTCVPAKLHSPKCSLNKKICP